MVATRNFIFLFLCLFGLAACQQEVKILKGRVYEITGQVANCEGCEVVLQLFDYNQYKTVDQTPIEIDTVQNGTFTITGRITRPGFYEILIKEPKISNPVSARIYLPTRSVKITADVQGLPNSNQLVGQTNLVRPGTFSKIKVSSSSPLQEKITEYYLIQDSLSLEYEKKDALTIKMFRATFTSENRQLMNAWADSVRLMPNQYLHFKAKAADEFIRRNPESEVAILAMLENIHESSTHYRFKQYFEALPVNQQNTYYGQKLAQKLNQPPKAKKARQSWVGGKITYLKGRTPAGEEIDAQQIFKENKFTLVNFWASWHSHSRSQMPEFQKVYQQHQDQGFEIIAVSFDRSQSAWTQTIADAKLTFRQVSELNGDLASEYKRFRIRELPFNILFDENGTMVAVDLTPQELAAKLKKSL